MTSYRFFRSLQEAVRTKSNNGFGMGAVIGAFTKQNLEALHQQLSSQELSCLDEVIALLPAYLSSAFANGSGMESQLMEQNRQIVEQAFSRWRLGQGSILDLMDDGGIVVIPGTAAHCGSTRKQQFFAEIAWPFMSRFREPPVPIPTLILAAGDHVIVAADAEGTTLNEQPYRNQYVFVLEFREGNLVKATEFLDMLAFNVVWDSVEPPTLVMDVVGESK